MRMTGYCQAPGFGRVGFGECTGGILPAGTKLEPLADSWDSALGALPLVKRNAAAGALGGRLQEDGVPSEPMQKGFIVGFGVGLVAASSLVWLLGTSHVHNRA